VVQWSSDQGIQGFESEGSGVHGFWGPGRHLRRQRMLSGLGELGGLGGLPSGQEARGELQMRTKSDVR